MSESKGKQAAEKPSTTFAIPEEPDESKPNLTPSVTIAKSKTKTGGSSSVKGVKSVKSVKGLGLRSMSRMKVRKPSYGFSGISGIGLISRSSAGNLEYKRPPALFLPTYQLESQKPFNIALAQKTLQKVIDDYFLDHKYHMQESPSLAMGIAQEVMRRIKALGFNRYRIFAVATIGQRRAQSYYNAVAFLWDSERDGYVNAQAEVTTAFLQVTVFAVYLD